MTSVLKLAALLLLAIAIFACERNKEVKENASAPQGVTVNASNNGSGTFNNKNAPVAGKEVDGFASTSNSIAEGNVSTLAATATGGTATYNVSVTDANGSSAPSTLYSWATSKQFDDLRSLISSSAAVERGSDTGHKFIRTAALKFKVKNVASATYAIEKLVKQMGGYVGTTNLSSAIDNKTLTAINADSTLETTNYTVSNSMVLRVPDTNLDSTLKALLPLIDFLDARDVKAEDVSLRILATRLAQTRAQRSAARLGHDIDTKTGKLGSVTEAEESMVNRQEQEDNAKIDALTLLDQIKLSAINIDIYQRRESKYEIIANDKNIDSYKPGFFKQLKDALHDSLQATANIIIFLLRIWYLVLIIVVLFVSYWRWASKKEN